MGLDKAEGVVVSHLKPGSPSDDAGISRRDVILEIEQKPVKDLEDYERILSRIEDQDLLFWIQRGETGRYVVVRLQG